MSKADKFGDWDLDSNLETRPFTGFTRDEDPKEIGKKRASNAFVISLDRIICKDQVREDFDEGKHQELVESIKAHGLQQPIKVRWSAEDQKHVVLMGERRYRACKDAGRTEIECTLAEENLTETEIVELQFIENKHRKALNAVEEAKTYKRLMDLHGCTAKDLSKRLQVADTTVQRSVRLLTLPADILEQVAAGKLTKTLIREIQKVKGENAEEEQRRLISEYKKSGHTAVAEKVQQKRVKQGVSQSKKGTNKTQTINNLKLQVTGKRKATKAEIAEALRQWADDLENDGRGRRAA